MATISIQPIDTTALHPGLPGTNFTPQCNYRLALSTMLTTTSRWVRLVAAASILCLPNLVRAGTIDHRYQKNEHVELWVNKVNIFLYTFCNLHLVADDETQSRLELKHSLVGDKERGAAERR
jgi:hypothetical protein